MTPAANLPRSQARRARETIECFKLNRTGLAAARKKVARWVRKALEVYGLRPIAEVRQIVLELLRTEHPFRAVVCQMLRHPEPALAHAVHTALADPDINSYARSQYWI